MIAAHTLAWGLPDWGVELIKMLAPAVVLLVLWWSWLLVWRWKGVPRVMRETMNTDMLPLDRKWLQSGWAAVLLAFVSMGAEKVLLRNTAPPALRIVALLAPVVPLIWFIVSWRRERFRGDELDRRIHLDALSFAFPAFLVMMVGYRVLESVGWPTPTESLRWQFLPFLYGLWIWISKFWYAGPDDRARAKKERA